MLDSIMKIVLLIILIANLLSVNLANNLALPCYGCHMNKSTTNESNNSIPLITGLEEDYFIQAFQEYKTNIRSNYLMNIISKGYSNKDIKALAKFFNKEEDNDK